MSAVHMVLGNAPATDKRIQEIKELTESDTTRQRLKSVIRSGWPDERTDIPEDILSYWNFRDELSEAEGIIMKGEKIIILTLWLLRHFEMYSASKRSNILAWNV